MKASTKFELLNHHPSWPFDLDLCLLMKYGML